MNHDVTVDGPNELPQLLRQELGKIRVLFEDVRHDGMPRQLLGCLAWRVAPSERNPDAVWPHLCRFEEINHFKKQNTKPI